MSMSVSDDTCTCGMDERDERRLKHFHRAFSTGQHFGGGRNYAILGADQTYSVITVFTQHTERSIIEI